MLDRLYKDVVTSPHDSNTVAIFFEEFERKKGFENESYPVYLKLKYFHDPEKFSHLNALGDLYLQEKKYFLAALCFIESIRLNPSQSHIFKKYEDCRDSLNPPPLQPAPAQEESVSVIMGTYNRNGEIMESIESVIHQTYQNHELILINDGGTGDVESVLSGLNREKITYVRLMENKGHAGVLNEGIRRSKGKYIAYLDDDDVYYPNHLESLVRALQEKKQKIAYSNTKMVCGTMELGRFKPERTKGHWSVPFDKNRLVHDNFISNLCIVHEREVLSEIGLYHEDLRVVMDWELWLRASLKYSFCHVDAYTGEYRFKESNITSSHRLFIDFYTELIRNYYSYFRGAVSRIRHYQENRWHEKAGMLYSRVKEEYENYFKSPLIYQELLELSVIFQDKIFLEKVAKDYFQTETRSFMRYVKGTKSFTLLYLVSPLIPGKTRDIVSGRIRRKKR